MAEQKKALITVDGNTLMLQSFPPLQFSVEKILPYGLFILAGSGKIGKSWLALDICKAVATGGELWDFNAGRGEVLYFALEDSYARLQSRLKIMETENTDISQLYMTTASLGIGDGLLEQIRNFLAEHPNTKLLVIDTWCLSTEMRIVSYISLGLILMLISFVYQRLSRGTAE